ncbi:MAG: iron-sulfur cluster insertion protein ErpA [Gammaproteobacteria bacterium]|nr:iron-sulfur cluster insertion protein ErpA [Gammaproteobacteria bacterium]NNJ97511.1 iron-sulfur cluster insertion protein ErpA [Gammaproteobacteria bacterium]
MSINVSFTPMQPKTAGTPAIGFTDAAANKLKSLISEENNPNIKLRVFVSGGGCSGFQYGFEFDESVNDDDIKVEKNGVMMVIDTMSAQYIAGATVDYQEGLEGSRFVIDNPNATSTCGCGASFSI